MNPSSAPHHSSPQASSPSHPLLTLVGLGPPLEFDEQILAAMTAYVEDEPVLADAEDTPNDAITLVTNYDEITVVTKTAPAAPAPVRAESSDLLAAIEPAALLALEAPTHALPEAPPAAAFTEPDGVEEAPSAVLVEAEPEHAIFAPSLDSFVPPPRRFPGMRLAIALGVGAVALGLVAFSWAPSRSPAPVSQRAPERAVTLPNDQATTEARARAVARALEASVAERTPATEVVSVQDLRVKPKASRTQLASAPATPFVPVDLDGSSDVLAARSTLTVTSNPPSNVVVDGRPLGTTPHELSVSAGPHSVVFIHPQKGRKSLSVEATAGKSTVAHVSF